MEVTAAALHGCLLWRYLRRTFVGVVAVVTLLQVIAPVGMAYLLTHATRPLVLAAALRTSHENVAVRTSDGLRLVGWYIPSRNGAAVIAFPGRKGPQAHARMLARHGYGVLLFDRRGEGDGEGDGNLFGWGGDRDLFAPISFLKGRADVEPGRIGGIGFSDGGELMLQAAARSQDLAAVVSEGAGTRSFAEERDELPGPAHWFDNPGMAVRDVATAVLSNTTPPPKLTDLIRAAHLDLRY